LNSGETTSCANILFLGKYFALTHTDFLTWPKPVRQRLAGEAAPTGCRDAASCPRGCGAGLLLACGRITLTPWDTAPRHGHHHCSWAALGSGGCCLQWLRSFSSPGARPLSSILCLGGKLCHLPRSHLESWELRKHMITKSFVIPYRLCGTLIRWRLA